MKTPKEILIEEMNKLADDMEAGKITHVSQRDDEYKLARCQLSEKTELFNMYDWHCGTVGCIGGFLEYRLKALWSGKEYGDERRLYLDAYQLVGESTDELNLNELFHPPVADWDAITPQQAAVAIRNTIATGKPNWKEVVEGVK